MIKKSKKERLKLYREDLEKAKRLEVLKKEIEEDISNQQKKTQKIVYPYYHSDTDIKKIAKEFVKEYKRIDKIKKTIKLNIIEHEEWLKRKL
tara:strand:- start:40 stop:315 length:276 start_codon:yes stop_codon:yes gene_type:complete